MAQFVSQVKFVIETMEIVNGEALKSLRPDKDGYYDVPLAVIGIPTRNRTFYYPKEFIDALTSNKSPFNMLVLDGGLYGEWGHPFTQDLNRIMQVDEKCYSHHIRKVYADREVDGGTLIKGKLKPFGPYGKYLEQSLHEPYMNTAFSLRSICTEMMDTASQLIKRTIKHLVTFDGVGASGYKQSTKRYASAGIENMSIPLQIEDFFKSDGVTYACESKVITDGFLTDLFGARAIKFSTTSIPITGTHIQGRSNFIGSDGNKHSIAHALLAKR